MNDGIKSLSNNTIQKIGSQAVEIYVCHAKNVIKYWFSQVSLQFLNTTIYEHWVITYLDVLELSYFLRLLCGGN